MLFLPPGSAKSTYASVLFPSWYLGRNPQKAIIGASNTGELSETFGRRVRNIVAQQEYSNVFNVTLSPDSQAAGRWSMTNQSEYYAVGIGGSVVGRRSDLGIIDDPVKSREDAESELSRNKVWDWYKTDFYTRLKPNAAVILIMCMTGDTPVLMADGKEKPLREIKVGDNVATYENGRLKNSKVLNHSSNGDDFIYRITMSSGKVVRANERHPFLVEEHGGLKWVQLKDLTIAHKIVTLRGSGGNGKAKPVWLKAVVKRWFAEDTVARIIIKKDGLTDTVHHRTILNQIVNRVLNTTTVLRMKNTIKCLHPKMGNALYANNFLQKMLGHIGAASFALTTAMKQAKLEACYAMTAILPLAMPNQKKTYLQWSNTSDFTTESILSIEPSGIEEVFDVQIERTENFIANGLVSHNTRYHEDDLAGRLLVDSENGGEQWEVLKLPMLALDNDPLGREFGELLWPEWFNDDMVTQARRDERVWSSLYQQEPTSLDGGLFKREWFKRYKTAPPDLHKYMTSDHAPAGMSHNDYSGVRVWGIDHLGDIYLLDGFRAQETMDITCDKALKLIERHKPFAWFPENDNNWKSVSGFVTRMMRERNIFTRIEPISPHGADKPTKAQAFQAMVASGRVYIPDTHEGDEIISQYTKFPDAKNDDEVDMGSLIGRAIADAHPAILKIKEVPKTRDIWAMQFDKDEESWKTA